MQLIEAPVSLVVIIFFFLGPTWAFLVLLPFLLPLLLVIAAGHVIWKSVTGNYWFQQAKMPQALVWHIWGCVTKREGC